MALVPSGNCNGIQFQIMAALGSTPKHSILIKCYADHHFYVYWPVPYDNQNSTKAYSYTQPC